MALDLDGLGELAGELTAADLAALAPDAPPPARPAAVTQRVTVIMEDATTYEATLDARDRRAYALLADRYGLPAFTLLPHDPTPDLLLLELLTAFSAWHAVHHRAKVCALDWPAFSAQCVEVIAHPSHAEPVPYPPARGVD